MRSPSCTATTPPGRLVIKRASVAPSPPDHDRHTRSVRPALSVVRPHARHPHAWACRNRYPGTAGLRTHGPDTTPCAAKQTPVFRHRLRHRRESLLDRPPPTHDQRRSLSFSAQPGVIATGSRRHRRVELAGLFAHHATADSNAWCACTRDASQSTSSADSDGRNRPPGKRRRAPHERASPHRSPPSTAAHAAAVMRAPMRQRARVPRPPTATDHDRHQHGGTPPPRAAPAITASPHGVRQLRVTEGVPGAVTRRHRMWIPGQHRQIRAHHQRLDQPRPLARPVLPRHPCRLDTRQQSLIETGWPASTPQPAAGEHQPLPRDHERGSAPLTSRPAQSAASAGSRSAVARSSRTNSGSKLPVGLVIARPP